jgi:hypothetical protein
MAQGYETQSYDVIQTFSEGEIRFYPPVMKVKTNNKSGFSSLFKYISGNNSAEQKIAMTTPVHMDKNEGSETMEFVLPKQFDLDNTPLPVSSNVEIYKSKAGYFAAFKFGGYTNTKKEQMIIEKGKKILAENNISFFDSPVVLVYNSPYTFFNRKNEILFAIKFSK